MGKLKQVLSTGTAVAVIAILAGCAQTAPADDAIQQINRMSAQERFEQIIKPNTGMSLEMKDSAIDQLDATDEQKTAWKAEIRQAAPATGETPASR